MYQQGVGEGEQVYERESVAGGEAGAHDYLEPQAVVATRAVHPVRQTFRNNFKKRRFYVLRICRT